MINIFKNYNDREINKLKKKAKKIVELDYKFKNLSDIDLKNKTFEFKNRLNKGEKLEDLINEVFAVCREATFRVLGKKQYKVQIMGGIALHQGRIVEMKTGEGKTLTELCPAYLNALNGKGVHIVTANEYLAERDKLQMEKVFEFLNISVGLVIKNTVDKKKEYKKDIVYTTNEELGFDYLRDNLVYDLSEKVQRELNYVIIDEVDSVLIDDAKTPLIISEEDNTEKNIYYKVDKIVKKLNEEDYYIDEKEDSIYLSDLGIKKFEKIFKIDDLTLHKNNNLNNIIHKSLIANYLLVLDKDYVIKENKILLIDSNTGRIAEGRVYSDGLQQCVEAKEGIDIKSGSKTLATITYQSFFKLYNKISGMSGTVKTEEYEFREIYNMDVIVIPTNKSVIRKDNIDKVFISKAAKLKAVLDDVVNTNKKGQPILIGTQSIKESEEIYKFLKNNNLNVKLLNARNVEEEANIIKNAGKKGSILVATNIAGRGTDILLSNESIKLGGLKVIGIGRSEDLRIDNQLIGRAGRQGEPGESQIYVSCDDDLLKIYGENKLKLYLDKKRYKNCEIKSKLAKKYIKSAQRYINWINFSTRKNTVKYDEVISLQRNIIYRDRDFILKCNNLNEIISKMLAEYIKNMFKYEYEKVINKSLNKKNIFLIKIENIEKTEFVKIKNKMQKNILKNLNCNIEFELNTKKYIFEFLEDIINKLIDYFNEKFILNDKINENSLRKIFLSIIDNEWKEYLVTMDYLKYCVINQTYNQKDPIEIYRLKSKNIFDRFNEIININLIKYIFNIV